MKVDDEGVSKMGFERVGGFKKNEIDRSEWKLKNGSNQLLGF